MNDDGQFEAALGAPAVADFESLSAIHTPEIPAYLRETYWWAYLHPNAVRIFEREWLVNLILWGNMQRLTDTVLNDLQVQPGDSILQLACVYGRFSEQLAHHLDQRGATLDLVDIAPIQLANARRKLTGHSNVRFHHMDSSALNLPANRYQTTVLFFLLHEQPWSVRQQTMREALRVTKPGGRIIVVDYHNPSRLNPLRYFMRPLLHRLEPFALDLWEQSIESNFSAQSAPDILNQSRYFGGLYQKVVMQKGTSPA